MKTVKLTNMKIKPTVNVLTTALVGLQRATLLTLAMNAHAGEAGVDFEAATGIEYDGNVNVQELDKTIDAADTVVLLNTGVNGHWRPSDKLTLKAGYEYATKTYREYDDFDQRIGTLSADAAYRFEVVDLGGSYIKAKARLASDPFLTLSQESFYAGKLFNNSVYWRAAFNRTDKTFANDVSRDSDGTGLDTDVFVFFNGAATVVSFGVGNQHENARSALYDNGARSFRGRWSNTFSWWGKQNKIQLGWRYLDRDYDSTDPAIGARRKDVRRSGDASWEIELTPVVTIISSIRFNNNTSNLPAADYRETVASVLLQANF